MIEGLVAVIIGIATLYFIVWFFILLPSRMAETRGRSTVVWVLVSIFFSPFLAIFLLWVLGDA